MSAHQKQKTIDFATEGFRIALPAECNCGIQGQWEVFRRRHIFLTL
jgi:hypothetical protein